VSTSAGERTVIWEVRETEQADPLPFGQVAYPPGLVRSLVTGRREILLLKKSFDVFTSPNAEAVLESLDPAEVLVFGVATDVCDHAAITGACLAEWREAGVRFTTSERVDAGDGH
jgi:nicotinamidase-related amidase